MAPPSRMLPTDEVAHMRAQYDLDKEFRKETAAEERRLKAFENSEARDRAASKRTEKQIENIREDFRFRAKRKEEIAARREGRAPDLSRFQDVPTRRERLEDLLDVYSQETAAQGGDVRHFRKEWAARNNFQADRTIQEFEKSLSERHGFAPTDAARRELEQQASSTTDIQPFQDFEQPTQASSSKRRNLWDGYPLPEKKPENKERIHPGVERRTAAQKLVAEKNAAAAKRIEDLRNAAYARPKPTRAVNQDGAHISLGEKYVDLPKEDWDDIDTDRPSHQAQEVLGKRDVRALLKKGDFANEEFYTRGASQLLEGGNTMFGSNRLFGESRPHLQLEGLSEEDRRAPSSDVRSYANRFGYPGASKWNTPNEQPRRAPLQLEAQNPVESTDAPQPVPKEDGPEVTYRAGKKKNLGLTLGDVEDLEARKDLSDPNTSGDRFRSGKELARAARGFAKEYNRPDVAERVAELERAYASASQRPAESTTESTPSKATVAAPPELPSSKDRRTSSFVSPAAAEILDAMNANFGDELSARREAAAQKAPSTKENSLRNEETLPSDTEQMREDIENALRRDREQLVTRPERAKQTQEASVIVDPKILQEGRRAELLVKIDADTGFVNRKTNELQRLQSQLDLIEDGDPASGKPSFKELYGTTIAALQNNTGKKSLGGILTNLWHNSFGKKERSANAILEKYNEIKAQADIISESMQATKQRLAENRQEVAEIERRATETEETRKQNEHQRVMERRMSSAKNPSPSRAAGFIDTNNKNPLEKERNDHENRVASLAQFLLDHGKRAKQDEALETARSMMTHMNDEELYNYKEDAEKESAERNAQAAMAARTKSLPRDLNTRFSVPSSSNRERRYGSLNVTASRAGSSEVKATETPSTTSENIDSKGLPELTPLEKTLTEDTLGPNIPRIVKAYFKDRPELFAEAIKSSHQFAEMEASLYGFGDTFRKLNAVSLSDAKKYIADGINRLSLNPKHPLAVLKRNGTLDQCITNVQNLYEGIREESIKMQRDSDADYLPPYKEGAIETLLMFKPHDIAA